MCADVLLILTEVEKAAIRFGKPDQEDLGHISLAQAAQYAAEGQFGVEATTIAWSHSSRMASISTIRRGWGEGTTRRQPRPASSRMV